MNTGDCEHRENRVQPRNCHWVSPRCRLSHWLWFSIMLRRREKETKWTALKNDNINHWNCLIFERDYHGHHRPIMPCTADTTSKWVSLDSRVTKRDSWVNKIKKGVGHMQQHTKSPCGNMLEIVKIQLWSKITVWLVLLTHSLCSAR